MKNGAITNLAIGPSGCCLESAIPDWSGAGNTGDGGWLEFLGLVQVGTGWWKCDFVQGRRYWWRWRARGIGWGREDGWRGGDGEWGAWEKLLTVMLRASS